MTPAAIDKAAGLLLAAEADRKRIVLPDDARPSNEAESIAIMRAIVRKRAAPIAGYKIGAADPKARAKSGLSAPFTGAIPESLVTNGPATFRHADMLRPVVESEYAFRMAQDLPARREPYSRAEVEAAIGELVLGIEVPESRLAEENKLSGLGTVADQGGVGRYVLGASFKDWKGFDIVDQPVIQWIDGKEVSRGTGGSMMGHPLEALTWFANYLSSLGEGLKAGQFVSTGSCTGVIPVPQPSTCVSDFGPLGKVEVTFT